MLLLAMVLAVLPMAYANSTQNFTNSETYLRTSYNNDNYVELSISGNTLTVSGKLLMDGLTGLMVMYGEQSRQFIDAASGQVFSVCVSLSHSGSLPISIYTQKDGKNTYWSYIWNRIYIEKVSGGYRIMPSLVLDQNLAFVHAYVDPNNFRDSSKVPDSVKFLSNQIVGGETNNYAKIFLLHKWVAENIYYDYDAYRGSGSTYYDSADILATKRSVCEGYANLLRDLILAQGIPCMKTSTYSLGVSSSGGSFAVKADSAAANSSNHAHVEAWVDEHWVIMDATWDSNNKYEDGAYNTDAPNGFYYFDITPEALALDHKYITRANGKVKMQNGVITGADAPDPGNGLHFPDRDSIQYPEAIETLVGLGVLHGYDDGLFHPHDMLTRGQACKILVTLYDLQPGSKDTVFDDVSDHWAKSYIMCCASLGIVAGYGDGSFGPNDPLTGDAWAKMLLVAMGYDADATGMIGGNWAEAVAYWADLINLFGGMGDDYRMSNAINREEACQMAYNSIR